MDVFHFKSKHSVNDHFCQEHCNPSAYDELLDDEGNWVFNTSIAEQNNVWVGGYDSICREMMVDRYNFFLDEMFMRKNRLTLAKLTSDGYAPRHWRMGEIV